MRGGMWYNSGKGFRLMRKARDETTDSAKECTDMAKKSPSRAGLLPVAYIILGLILILWPSMSSSIFCWIVGIGSLVYGLFHLLNFWRAARGGGGGRGELAVGIILAVLGIFCLVSPPTILTNASSGTARRRNSTTCEPSDCE